VTDIYTAKQRYNNMAGIWTWTL